MDLTRFDRQKEFNPVEIACLLCGADPAGLYPAEMIRNDLELIEKAFLNGFKVLDGDHELGGANGVARLCLFPVQLEKIFLSARDVDLRKRSAFHELARNSGYAPDEFDREVMNNGDGALDEYLDYFSHGNFDNRKFLRTKFSRGEIFNWLQNNGYNSKYSFGSSSEEIRSIAKGFGGSEETNDLVDEEFDPSDNPTELDIANLAFHIVRKGYGDTTATFRNRLIEFLKEEYPGLKREAVDRIATVANPDKAPGRKPRS